METRKQLSAFLLQQIPSLKTHHMVGGTPADRDNQNQITVFKSAWFYLASDVLTQAKVWGHSLTTRLLNFKEALLKGDLLDLLNICQSVTDLLLQEDLNTLSWDAFKQHLTEAHPEHKELTVRLLSPIIPLLTNLLDSEDVYPESLRGCLQFLRFGKKLHLESIGLEEKALSSYLDIEDNLARLDFSNQADVIQDLNKIMRRWLRRLDLRDLIPNHGNGSVAEGSLTLYEKYKSLRADLKISVVVGQNADSYYSVGNMTAYAADLQRSTDDVLSRVSRTIFVPKTFSKLRTISMEPTTIQFWQQAIMKKVYDYISCHKHLRYCVQLEDQEYNRRMAKRGSKDGCLATIDLSAASDSVSWSLVKAIFSRTPLMKWLYATRSEKTELPDGTTLPLAKFAPMGSALCFPIQCLIFAAVIEYVTQKCATRIPSEHPGYAVYGDDMIVATSLAPEVMDTLVSLGFTVNRDKSFINGKFRESCGGDYYDGSDVSSVYYKFKIDHKINLKFNTRLKPECYAAIASVCNLCYKHGLLQLREFFLKLIRRYYPYFTDSLVESPNIFSPQPTNFHSRKRWHEDYQCWVARFCTVLSKPVQRAVVDADDVAYLVRLGQLATRKSVRPLDEEVVDIALHGTTLRLGRVEREVIISKPLE